MSNIRRERVAILLLMAATTNANAQPVPGGPRTLDLDRHECGVIRRMAFSPDGSVFAVAGTRWALGTGKRVLALWSVATGQHLRTFRGDDASDEAFAFSPDGKVLAIPLEKTEEILLWDVTGAKEIRRLKHPRVDAVEFSASGKYLQSSTWRSAGDRDGDELRVWESATGKQVFATPWVAGSDSVFAADDRLLFWSPDRRLRCWDPATGRERPPVQIAPGEDAYIKPSPTGKEVLSVDRDTGRVRSHDATTGKAMWEIGRKRDWVSDVKFTHDGKSVLVLWEKQVEVLDAKTGARRAAFGIELKGGGYPNLMPLPDGRHVFVCGVILASDGSGVFQNSVVYTLDGRLIRRAPDVWDTAFDPSARSIALKQYSPRGPGRSSTMTLTIYDLTTWLAGEPKKD
jgi:WD40 repeat protein